MAVVLDGDNRFEDTLAITVGSFPCDMPEVTIYNEVQNVLQAPEFMKTLQLIFLAQPSFKCNSSTVETK